MQASEQATWQANAQAGALPAAAVLRIGLSAAAQAEHAGAIAAALGARPHELLSFESLADVPAPPLDIAFVSRDVTGLSTKHTVLPETKAAHDVLRRAPGLAWVHMHAAGADRPVYLELRERGVTVCTSSGANAEVVAQTALTGLLMLARSFPRWLAAQREGRWAPVMAGPLPRDLAGQTALIVGWGPIGQRLAALLQMLGLHVVVVRRDGSAPVPGIETVAYSRWHDALPRADWLLLACPLSAVTRALVDAAALAALPPGAQLVNVARGEVVVQRDLIDALQSGRLAGAYLDVFEHEPLTADSPLWALENVIVTPHAAGHSDGNEARVAAMFVDNLRRWCAGRNLVNAVA